MRARAPVSYNDKDPAGMVPAWLKTIQPNVNDPPAEPKRRKKTTKSKKNTGGTPDKENASDSPPNAKAPTVKSKGPAGKSRGATESTRSQPKNKGNDNVNKRAVAARGRNAGLKIIPIGT